jgi:CRP-like cAMP-binding protein
MTFFDYPDSDATAEEQAADVFLPEASERDWAVLFKHCRRRRFGPGESVISAGATTRSLFLVIEGALEVLVPTGGRGPGGPRRVVTLGPGNVLGEMSFFDHAGRSALVRATATSEVAELGRAELDALTEEDPQLGRQILFDLGRILAQRLRRAQGPS